MSRRRDSVSLIALRSNSRELGLRALLLKVAGASEAICMGWPNGTMSARRGRPPTGLSGPPSTRSGHARLVRALDYGAVDRMSPTRPRSVRVPGHAPGPGPSITPA